MVRLVLFGNGATMDGTLGERVGPNIFKWCPEGMEADDSILRGRGLDVCFTIKNWPSTVVCLPEVAVLSENRESRRHRLGCTHTMRHAYRSWFDAVGAPVAVQQKLIRHADIRTTMHVYG
jgi:hypothetical protein